MSVEHLARELAREQVWDWVYSDRWMGYPDHENPEEMEGAVAKNMPWAREQAQRYKELLEER